MHNYKVSFYRDSKIVFAVIECKWGKACSHPVVVAMMKDGWVVSAYSEYVL